MYNHKHYIPILKGKRGELSALMRLSDDVRERILPLLDIQRVPLVFPKNSPTGVLKCSLEEHLKQSAEKIVKALGDAPLLLDTTDIPLEARVSGQKHYFRYLLDALSAQGSNPYPVTGLDRDKEYNLAVKGFVARTKGCNVGIRLLADDIENYSDTMPLLEKLLNTIGVSPKECFLILDHKAIEGAGVDKAVETSEDFICNLFSPNDWRSLTVAGSGFPQTMQGIERKSISRLRRHEFSVWSKLQKKKKDLPRQPSLGDYGITHPDSLEFDPRKFTMGGKIRYTTENEWIIVKGTSFKTGEKGLQYHSLSKELIKMTEFLGADFSWGDEYVTKCAAKKVGPGNLEMWICIDTNHHICFVTEQLANVA
ncbi:MAG: beta family protein [Deltaproteobacteria bacterium]|nr:beta family protein [Deltaproteobacteria bacterium]